jgi:hypothetical protein
VSGLSVGFEGDGVGVDDGIGSMIVHSFDPVVRERVQAKETAIIELIINQNLIGTCGERCIGGYSILKTIYLAIGRMQVLFIYMQKMHDNLGY